MSEMVVIPKRTHKVLSRLTRQSRADVALSLAIKELVRLRIKEVMEKIAGFEQKYGMIFSEFETACDDGRIQNPYSYEVEKDDFEWEAAISDLAILEDISQWLV